MSKTKYIKYDEKIVNEVRKKIYEIVPKEYFQERFGKRTPNYIKLLLVRETTGYLIIRSTDPDEVISTEIGDKEVVVIPSRKLKAREKLTGLILCRKFGVVHPTVEYNFIKKQEQLANPNSLVFGDSVTEEREAIGLPARVLYEWSYSLRPKNEIIDELTHNALSEEGTMWDKEKGTHRESLYDVQYIKPGVYFPQFIVFPDITPEGFLHVLISVMKTTRYGAQSNVMDANMRNHIVAIALDEFEPAVSSYTLSRDWSGRVDKKKSELQEGERGQNDIELSLASIKAYTVEKLKEYSKIVKYDNDGEQPISKLIKLINDLINDNDKLKEIYKKLLNDSIAYLVECKVIKEDHVINYLKDLKIE